MKIGESDFNNLKTLLTQKEITYGKFINKEIPYKLQENGAVRVVRKSAKRKIVFLQKSENVFLFLKNNAYNLFSVQDIEHYVTKILNDTPDRAIIQHFRNDTKEKESQSLRGLYISSLSFLQIKIDNEVVDIVPHNGLGYFCFYTQKIEIDEDTVIVGVENYQVVWFAKRYKEFFKEKKALFVVINPYMLEWIEDLSNEYIHFGDYDIAGINIYLQKVLPRLKKAKKSSFFIPENIEELLGKYGNNKLYEKQIKDINTIDEDLIKLKNLIVKYKKGLEQEGIFTS